MFIMGEMLRSDIWYQSGDFDQEQVGLQRGKLNFNASSR
jgi:hypothetical protein